MGWCGVNGTLSKGEDLVQSSRNLCQPKIKKNGSNVPELGSSTEATVRTKHVPASRPYEGFPVGPESRGGGGNGGGRMRELAKFVLDNSNCLGAACSRHRGRRRARWWLYGRKV
jgi:hypothetical protein